MADTAFVYPDLTDVQRDALDNWLILHGIGTNDLHAVHIADAEDGSAQQRIVIEQNVGDEVRSMDAGPVAHPLPAELMQTG